MKTTASLSETMIAAAAAFRVSGRAKPRMLRRLLRFGADLAYVSAPDESIERPPAARWFYDNARMLEEACADALDALRGMKPLPADGRVLVRRQREAGQVVRLDAAAHQGIRTLKLSLLDLPVRPDQLIELIPQDLRQKLGRELED